MNNTYRIWFNDGGEEIFDDSSMDKMADRFGFDADELRKHGETEMTDDDGDVIGGVVTWDAE